jgi:hypothetical protein
MYAFLQRSRCYLRSYKVLTPEGSFLKLAYPPTSCLGANNATLARQNFPVGANFFCRRQLRFKKLASGFEPLILEKLSRFLVLRGVGDASPSKKAEMARPKDGI